MDPDGFFFPIPDNVLSSSNYIYKVVVPEFDATTKSHMDGQEITKTIKLEDKNKPFIVCDKEVFFCELNDKWACENRFSCVEDFCTVTVKGELIYSSRSDNTTVTINYKGKSLDTKENYGSYIMPQVIEHFGKEYLTIIGMKDGAMVALFYSMDQIRSSLWGRETISAEFTVQSTLKIPLSEDFYYNDKKKNLSLGNFMVRNMIAEYNMLYFTLPSRKNESYMEYILYKIGFDPKLHADAKNISLSRVVLKKKYLLDDGKKFGFIQLHRIRYKADSINIMFTYKKRLLTMFKKRRLASAFSSSSGEYLFDDYI
jgi:hypothetical protein